METFITDLCERLGVPIDDVDVNSILDLAKDVARSVERPAAPVATFIAGYAVAAKGGGTEAVDEALDTTAEVGGEWAEAHGTPDYGPTLDAPSTGNTTDTGNTKA